mgnify:CR=1 FL=1
MLFRSAFTNQNWAAWQAMGIRYVVATHPMERPRQGTVRFQTRQGLWIVEM